MRLRVFTEPCAGRRLLSYIAVFVRYCVSKFLIAGFTGFTPAYFVMKTCKGRTPQVLTKSLALFSD